MRSRRRVVLSTASIRQGGGDAAYEAYCRTRVPPGGFRLGFNGEASRQVFTSRDSPRTIWRVMVEKCVWRMHFQANWNR